MANFSISVSFQAAPWNRALGSVEPSEILLLPMVETRRHRLCEVSRCIPGRDTRNVDSFNATATDGVKFDEKNASSTSLPLPDGSKSTYGTDVVQQVRFVPWYRYGVEGSFLPGQLLHRF